MSDLHAQPDAPAAVPARGFYRDPRLKSPVLAAVLSLMPGLGQVYLGFTRLGFVHGFSAAAMIALMASNRLGALEPLVGFSLAFFWLYNVVDAHRRALLVNEALLRLEPSELPDDLGALPVGVRLALGLGLIGVGILSFLSKFFGLSFAWLLDWWPLGFVALGLYLVVRAVKDRTAPAETPKA